MISNIYVVILYANRTLRGEKMAYRLHNEEALMAAAQLIANALNITTITDSSPPTAHSRLWGLRTAAEKRGMTVRTDQLTGHIHFHLVTDCRNSVNIVLGYWSPEVPTTITIGAGRKQFSSSFIWNGITMVAQSPTQPPLWLRTLADPEISPGRSWLGRIAGCTRRVTQILGFQQT